MKLQILYVTGNKFSPIQSAVARAEQGYIEQRNGKIPLKEHLAETFKDNVSVHKITILEFF